MRLIIGKNRPYCLPLPLTPQYGSALVMWMMSSSRKFNSLDKWCGSVEAPQAKKLLQESALQYEFHMEISRLLVFST